MIIISDASQIDNIESLLIKLESKDAKLKLHTTLLCGITDNLALAVWSKDVDNRFTYANDVCCKTILGCRECEAIAKNDSDFKNGVLSMACIKSDNIVKDRQISGRFIEHARYPSKDVWLDTVKQPMFDGDELIGTMGFGAIITPKVSQKVRDKYKDADAFEIPLDAEINDALIEMYADGKSIPQTL